jgi:APA family basic amino acid/polyamine antiporter
VGAVVGQRGTLLRVLGTGFGIAAVIGSVIGVGILRVPSELAANLHSPVLFIGIWLVGATVAALGANCVAELAVMLPKAGGPYVYVRRAYGDYPGFLIGWVDWFLQVGSAAFILVALGEYGIRLAPAFPGGPQALGLAAITSLFIVHASGLRAGSRSQEVLSAAKAAAFLGVALVCLFAAPTRAATAEINAPSGDISFWALLAVLSRAAVMVNETYAGWNSPVYLTEENRDPARSIPRALFSGIAIVASIYVLLNLALLSVLSLDEVAQSKLPVADATARVMGEAAGSVVTFVAIVSLLGLCHANLFQAPRVLLALSRDGWFHSAASSVTDKGALIPGLAVSVCAMTILALTGTFEELFVSIALLGLAQDAFVYTAVLRLRRTDPGLPRPYRAKGYPWLPLLVILYAFSVLIAAAVAEPSSTVRGLLVLVLSVPAFLWLKFRHRGTPATAQPP